MKKYYWIFFVFIIVVAGYFRTNHLDSIPPHLGNDEISIAFDSYSVRLLGKDEHGTSWPISFKSHQTYKAPLYAYLNIPFNIVFGNTEYGVRLLSVFSSLIAIIFVFLIGVEFGSYNIGIFSAILLAINPKNIFVSRIAFESNLAMAVMLVGIWAMIRFRKNKKFIYSIIAGIFLGLSVWGYHTQWGLVPILMFVWIYLSRNEVSTKSWWITVAIVFCLSLPIYYDFVHTQLLDTNNRASSQLWLSSGEYKDYIKNSQDSSLKKISKTISIPVYNYIQHFGFDTNFTSGLDLFNTRSPLGNGWFLLSTAPLLLIGLVKGKKYFGKWWTWLLSWWLICPIIPSTTGTVTSVRNLAFIIPTILLMGAGVQNIFQQYKKLFFALCILVLLNFGLFLIAYFVHFPIDSGNNFQYGYKQAWEYVKPNINRYDHIIVETRFGQHGQYAGVPHLYFGYFGAFDVSDMQNRIDINGVKIAKYEFRYVDWFKEIYHPNTLYIVSAINPKSGLFVDKLKEIGTIRNTDFEKQFIIYEIE